MKHRLFVLSVLFIMSFFLLVSAEENAPEESSPLKIIPESLTIEVGDPLIVDGFIDESIMWPYPGTVILIIRAPMASQIDAYTTLTPNSNGTFRYRVNTDVTGTWTVSGRYGDEISSVTEVKVIPREIVKAVTNTLNSHTGPVVRGEYVTMTGYLRDSNGIGLANKEVVYMVALPPYGCSICDFEDLLIWNRYGPVLTDSVGRYSISFRVADGGIHRIKTIFSGDETYQGSESPMRTITA